MLHVATLLSAAALFTGSLSGTVTKSTTGAPVDNYRVDLYDSAQTLQANTCTAPDGSYGFSGLTAGNFYVNFSGKEGCAASTLAPMWWNNHFSMAFADPVAVTDANDTPGIDAALPEGAQISGRVTDADSGQGVRNVAVEVRDVSARTVAHACTGADGTYRVDGLIAGVMTVVFLSDGSCGQVAAYPTQFWRDAETYNAAAAVNLAPSVIVENIDGHLRVGKTPAPGGGGGSGTTPPPPPVQNATAPVVSALKLSRAGTLSLRVSSSATIAVKVERRVGKRWRSVKRIASRAARAGAVKVALKLRTTGRYRVTVTATANGLTSRAVTKTARVAVKRK